MNRRALLVLNAAPSQTGAAPWRRFLMLAKYFAANQFEVTALHCGAAPLGQRAAMWLMAASDHVAFGSIEALEQAARRLDQAEYFDVVCALDPDLSAALQGPDRALRIVDLQAPVAEQDQEALQHRLASSQMVLTAEPAQTRFVEAMDRIAAEVPALIDGARKMRPRLRKSQLLAGVWVERDRTSVEAVAAFFDEVVARGGGGAPNFVIAGPGAGEISPPPLPFPVTHLDNEVEEMAFYRGLDLVIAPDLAGQAPRLDVVSALECGAAPLASSSALNGLRRRWRLPHFRDLGAMADFLFNRCGELRDGGLLTELRARADWTLSGLVTASARQRERLNREIRANLPG